MTNDLITWKQEPAAPAESWSDIIGVTDDAETAAYHKAALEQEQARIAEENKLASLSDKELHEQWETAAKKHEAETLPQRQIDSVHRFIQATPELVLNQKTMTRIDAYLKAAKLDASDPAHFDQAYRALSTRCLLDIDESRRIRKPYQRYTEEDLAAMPIDQLRELAEAEAGQR
jgi:hypothetical protein